MTFELFISRRYFKSKPEKTIIAFITLLSITGVAIGVTALIVVIAVMAGFESDLKSRIMGIEPHLLIDQNRQPHRGYEKLTQLVDQTPGVRSAWPVIELQVMLRADSRIAGALIKGVDPKAADRGLKINALNALLTVPGKASSPKQPPPIVLGRDIARNLGLEKGDTLFVVSPSGTLSPVGFVPFMKRFMVAGFFETGMYEYDNGLAYINLEQAQVLTRRRNSVSGIEVRLDNMFDTQAVAKKIQALEDGKHLRIRSWTDLNKNLFSALKLEKAAMFITLTLIILVATFSIISSLVMLVIEKIKDIAILRVLGVTRAGIRRIFMIQGLLIGCIGTVSGVILGLGVCLLQMKYHLVRLPGDVYYITALPVVLNATDVLAVAFSTLLICFLATLYPAHQAARLNPVEAIRHG
ncbi:MAG: lipoprotein-releasing ABC transporter permease subunit [Desulfosarcinaceae bacterium]